MTRIGLECKLFYNTGTYGSPTWVEAVNVRDLTMPLAKGEADTSRRGKKFRTRRGTLLDLSFDFNLIQEDGDAFRAALLDSVLNNTPIELLALDGDVDEVGSEGWRATCEIFKNDRTEALEDAVMYDYSAKPTDSDNDPEWYEVEGS